MCLDSQGRTEILHSWTVSDIEHRTMELSCKVDVYRIHAVGWQGQSRSVDVGGRKTQRPSELIPGRDVARDGVRAAQHLASKVELAIPDATADASTANGLTVQRQRSDAVNRKVEIETEFPEHFHIAATIVAKYKIRAHANALDPF